MAVSAAIVIIGDELLSGIVQDTNSFHIARRLSQIGIAVRYKATVPDDSFLLEQELRRLMEKYDVVITSGGLGTTVDDVTKRTVTRLLGMKLVLRDRIVEEMKNHFVARGEEVPSSCYSQALMPQGAVPISNPKGTAPGFAVETNGRWLVVLPGVPSEMVVTLDGAIPLLPRDETEITEYRTIRTTGIAESKLHEMLREVVQEKSGSLAFLPSITGVDIRLSVRRSGTDAAEGLKDLEETVLSRIDGWVYGRDDETLERIVGYLLTMRKLTLSVAESCTGGLVKHRITNVPGSSNYFLGGVVAYHNDVKEKLLGVPKSILAKHGAVSKETAIRMAEGVRTLLSSDIGIATTGIAGPTGATPSKPLGLVHIGLSTSEATEWEEHRFGGERVDVKEQSAQATLEMLRKHLTA